MPLTHTAVQPSQAESTVTSWLIQEALEAAAAAMAQYRATRVLDDAQGPLFEAACTALCDTLAPYISDCLSQVRLVQVRDLALPRALHQRIRQQSGSTDSSPPAAPLLCAADSKEICSLA